jgi:energy-coupling factor transport system permease protein
MAVDPSVLFGRYVANDSPLVRLDPRTKLAVMALVIGSLLAVRTPLGLVPAALAFFAAAAASRLPLSVLVSGVRGIGWFLLITFLFQIVFVPGEGDPLARVGPLALTAEGLERGLGLSLSLLLTLLFANLLMLSTSPIEIADAMRASLAPLARWRVPVEDLALVSLITFRFVPALIDESERIRRAQIARGLSPGRGLVSRARAVVPLLVPLIEGVFRKADDLAVALEARGYEPSAQRTSYRELRFAARDGAALIVGCGVAAAAVWLALRARASP